VHAEWRNKILEDGGWRLERRDDEKTRYLFLSLAFS
jgi:hypothetical protein